MKSQVGVNISVENVTFSSNLNRATLLRIILDKCQKCHVFVKKMFHMVDFFLEKILENISISVKSVAILSKKIIKCQKCNDPVKK